jgi:hypothetical protein
MPEMLKLMRSDWPLNVLVASGWLLAVAGIGILFTRDAAPLDDAYVKVAIMATLVCALCWPRTRQA